ncbi:MAG TPA: LysE family transporter [Rhodospirillaceae bacterium]|nr:LysE family transporter [Rhodospirillaceae bacterium]
MSETIPLLLGFLVLLVVPGPTNALLAAAGAASGVRRSLALIPAVVTGYLLAIATLVMLLLPMARADPRLALLLRTASVMVLLHVGRRMWSEPPGPTGAGRFGQILVCTLFNPKSLVFAMGFLELMDAGRTDGVWACAFGLVVEIAVAAGGWIALGHLAGLGFGAKGRGRIVQRSGALVLFGFALIIAGTALPFLRGVLAR